ncbi:MAG TPA: sulfatase [Candidatus Limnocylindria bacterium]
MTVSSTRGAGGPSVARRRPNIVFVMADDHAAHAIGAYGSRVNATPGIDRLASGGMRFDACFCTNSICSPSRATILTGTYNHVNGVTTLDTHFDGRLPTFPKMLQAAGYQTAIVGKWHLGHGGIRDPTGFDWWSVLPDQGEYHDPTFLEAGERQIVRQGYATDLITDLALEWIDRRDADRPFLAMVHHKAPHRSWEPADRHAHLYADAPIPEPPTLRDEHVGRSTAAVEARMRLWDLTEEDLKQVVPPGLTDDEELAWRYQRYMQDYLRCVAALDESVGRLVDHVDERGIGDDTVVVYTSDQGFFLGDHGWFDKRFMYEESLRMPFIVRYPRMVEAGTSSDAIVLNLDVAQTLLELAGVEPTAPMQGRSLVPLLRGETPADWRTSMYYRYWMHLDGSHGVWAHRGVRTHRHKLVHYYGDALEQPGAAPDPRPEEWELFDLEADPFELRSLHDHPDHAGLLAELRMELSRLSDEAGDIEPDGDPRRATAQMKEHR